MLLSPASGPVNPTITQYNQTAVWCFNFKGDLEGFAIYS